MPKLSKESVEIIEDYLTMIGAFDDGDDGDGGCGEKLHTALTLLLEWHNNHFDLAAHLRRQRDFSLKTFGPGTRTKGIVDHIRNELGEIEADPTDIMEWVDVIILAFDGAWRAGWEPEAIIATIIKKQTRNEGRKWPDWRTSDPEKAIEHVRTKDASHG